MTLDQDDLKAIEAMIRGLFEQKTTPVVPPPVPGSFMARLEQAKQCLASKGGK